MIIVSAGGCRPVQIAGREDFHLLDEMRQIEYDYSLHEGIKNRLLGEYERAYFFLRRSIEIFPYSDAAYFEISYLLFLAEELDEAAGYGLKALEIDPQNKWYHYHLAGIYREAGNYDAAIEVYREALRIFREEEDIYFTLSALYFNQNKYEKAIEIYDEVEELIGLDERISLSRKKIYMETGQYELAHNEISRLIQQFPEEPRYIGVLAELYAEMGMYSEALDSYKKVFMLDPENGIAQLSVAEFYISVGKFQDAVFYMVTAFRNPGLEYQEKLQVLSMLLYEREISMNIEKELIGLGNLLIEEYPGRYETHMLMSDYYLQTGNYEEAEKHLKEVYADDPENPLAAEQLIAVLGYQEKYEELTEVGVHLAKQFPGSGIISYFTGLALYNKDRKKEAVEILKRAVDVGSMDNMLKSHIYSYLGDIFNSLEDFDSSDRYFELSISTDYTNHVALNNYAYYLALRGEHLEIALEYSSLAVAGEPENPAFLDTYAWVLYNLGKYEKALEFIRKAYKLTGSERYEIVKHYGQILIKLEKYGEAVEYFREARELTDDYEEIDLLLRSVGVE